MVTNVLQVLAQQGPALNTQGIVQWVIKYILPLIVVLVGVSVAMQYKHGNLSQIGKSLGVLVVGLGLVAAAPLMFVFSEQIANLIFGGSG